MIQGKVNTTITYTSGQWCTSPVPGSVLTTRMLWGRTGEVTECGKYSTAMTTEIIRVLNSHAQRQLGNLSVFFDSAS